MSEEEQTPATDPPAEEGAAEKAENVEEAEGEPKGGASTDAEGECSIRLILLV